MKKNTILLTAIIYAANLLPPQWGGSGWGFAQNISINTTGAAGNASAILDIDASPGNNKGLLIPRLTTAQMNAIASPATGLIIYNTDCNSINYYNGVTWIALGNTGSVSTPGAITGNATPCQNATGVAYSIAAVSGATGYNWTVPAGASVATGQGTTSITANFATTNGNVCVTAYNACGSSNASCTAITLSTTPAAPTANAASSIAQTSFSANWTASAGATTYYLDVDDNSDFSSPLGGYNNLNAGAVTTYSVTGLTCNTTYYYRVRASNACGISTNSNIITVTTSACCTASAGIDQTTSCNVTIGGTPTASGGTPPYTYSWSPSTGLSNTTIANPTAFPTTTTIYTVTITDANLCTSTSSVTITVVPCVSNTWCRKADYGGGGASGGVGFSIGTKGYIGLPNNLDFWEWDQATNVWTQKASFVGPARANAVGFSIGTQGYIGTGLYVPTSTTLNDFWEWDQATNVWTQKANFGGATRYAAVGFSIGTKGYIGTGSALVYETSFWEYTPGPGAMGGSWIQKTNFGGTARTNATGFSIGTKGYIGTGYDGVNRTDLWEWDQATDTWQQKANMGGPGRDLAVGFSIGTKGYIGTGRDPGNSQDFWEYTPGAGVMGGSWVQKTNFGGSGRYFAVGFSIGNQGYIGTGSGSVDFWEYCQ